MSYKQKAADMYNMLNQGQPLDAFEKFYAENCVMHEATGDITEGKDANRKREQEFFGSIKEVHRGGVNAITSDEENGVTMVEAWMDLTFQDGNRMKMEEVAVQKWEGDQIVQERFYYNMPGQ